MYFTIENHRLEEELALYKMGVAYGIESTEKVLENVLELQNQISISKDENDLKDLLNQWQGVEVIAFNHFVTIAGLLPRDEVVEYLNLHNPLVNCLLEYGKTTSQEERQELFERTKEATNNYLNYSESIYKKLNVEHLKGKNIKPKD